MSEPSRQERVAERFEATYRRLGYRYLRPAAAYAVFLQLLAAKPGERLLDVACGPGLLLRGALARGVRAYGIDLAHTALGMAHADVAGAAVAAANAQELPFADRTFDLITCIGALERFFDRGRALAEMQRVARPGARLCIMVRNSRTFAWTVWRRWLRRQDHGRHQDAATIEEWRALLERHGLAIDAVHPDPWPWQRLRAFARWPRGTSTPGAAVARPPVPLRFANELIFVARPGTGR